MMSSFLRQKNMTTMRRQRGFTLLEVMLALSILALVGISISQSVGANVSNTLYMRQKTLARWIADNELTTIRLSDEWPKTEWTRSTTDMAGQEWHVRARSIETADSDFRMVVVEVRNQQNYEEPALERLETFMVRQ